MNLEVLYGELEIACVGIWKCVYSIGTWVSNIFILINTCAYTNLYQLCNYGQSQWKRSWESFHTSSLLYWFARWHTLSQCTMSYHSFIGFCNYYLITVFWLVNCATQIVSLVSVGGSWSVILRTLHRPGVNVYDPLIETKGIAGGLFNVY
jgi:hypothetical protein